MKTSYKQHFNVILDSISEGVFTIDQDWKITSFNRAAETITKVPRQEAIGKRCSEVLRASICESDCALKSTMKTGQPIVCRPIYIIDARGERIPISISTALLKDKKGDVIGGVETFRDLSLVEELRKELKGRHIFADIISRNKRMLRLFDILPEIAESDSAVLLEGESGTGKELFARAIHHLSPRKARPLIAVNCGALPDALLESELFGYKAGAFTDAKKDKPGRFARAEGGTIFLDEVGDVSPAMQVKLLRVLEEKVYEPLGSTRSVKADVRVITASNKNIFEMVKEGRFRQDLYYRINIVKMVIPPLRERREDIPILIDHFIGKFNRLRDKNIISVSPTSLTLLMKHDYPGNVRELENIIEHAFILCSQGMIEPRYLPEYLLPRDRKGAASPSTPLSFKEMEADFLRMVLEKNHWNRPAAARELGIHKTTLYRKIKSLGLKIPPKSRRNATI
ncbi:MAG: sigma 54-interacting transcriptional regulator [Candidatus Auribacterota bacterium]|nr:sigma 54-interacting transcriptional regulator [Candidatus Auribacterota bacterium]